MSKRYVPGTRYMNGKTNILEKYDKWESKNGHNSVD